MKITNVGKDLICVDDQDFIDDISFDHKIHLVKLNFTEPTIEKMVWVMNTFQNTNRFIIGDNISFYNGYLKHTNKKYYVVNTEHNKLVSFYKKNNKVLLDITQISEFERQFVFNVILNDILSCTEVIAVNKKDYIQFVDMFNNWNGNLIVLEDNQSL